MGFVAFWIIGAIVVAVVASSRGRSGFAYFFLSLLLSPLIGLVLAVAQPSLAGSAGQPSATTHRKCPHCAEFILPEASVCKHCHQAVEPDHGFTARQTATNKEEGKNLMIGIGAIAAIIAVLVAIGKL